MDEKFKTQHSNSVDLIGTYGSDERIALSAWQSTYEELNEPMPEDYRQRVDFLFNLTQGKKKKDYKKLLKFLADHKHHCYDEETKILTEARGWQYFKDLTEDDKVAAYNQETGCVQWELPIDKYVGVYDGMMFYLTDTVLNFAITKEHRVLVADMKGNYSHKEIGEWKIETTGYLDTHSVLMKTSSVTNRDIPSQFSFQTAFLIGFTLFRGCRLTPGNTLKIPVTSQSELQVLKSIGLPIANPHKLVVDIVTPDAELIYNSVSNKKYKRLPGKINSYSYQDVVGLMEGMMAVESCAKMRYHLEKKRIVNRYNPAYVNIKTKGFNPELIDDLSIVCALNGLSFVPGKRKSHYHRTYLTDHYPLSYYTDDYDDVVTDWKEYVGSVYCVSVSTGLVLVQRNGTPWISGNTPFEKSTLDFQVKGDIASHIHGLKHRIGVAQNSECLTGDSVVQFCNERGVAYLDKISTVEDLFNKWQDVKGRTAIEHSPLRVYDETRSQFTIGYVSDIWEKGYQRVHTITLRNGNQITCTDNHEILTAEGFKTIRTGLGFSDTVICSKSIDRSKYKSYSDPSYQDREEKLQALKEEAALQPVKSSIIGIQFIGDMMTYDIEVSGSHKNFVANNIVVHNSARYKELQDKWLIPSDWYDCTIDKTKLDEYPSEIRSLMRECDTWAEALDAYTQLGHMLYHTSVADLASLLGRKRAKESGRFFLTYNKQLNYDMMFNLRSFAHFCHLRAKPDAQKEIRELAQEMIRQVYATNQFNVSLEVLGLLELI